MKSLCLLAFFAALQEPAKAPQTRDEILKQDIESALKRLASERGNESYLAREELIDLGRRAVPAVVAELAKADTKPPVKRALCEILERVRDSSKDALKLLMDKLGDRDEYGTSIAAAAARALASIGDEACVPRLLETLKSRAVETDKVLKYECIRALGIFRCVEASEALRKALEDKKPASVSENDENAHLVAAAAAEALGLIRAQDAVDDLGKLIPDTTNDSASGQPLGVFAARALQRVLEPEFKGKTEKDDPRLGMLEGAPEETTKKTLDAWKIWWDARKGKKDVEETKAKIAKIHAAVEAFKKDQGFYPPTLNHLKVKPESAKTWPKDGYYQGDLEDAWKNPLLWQQPGTGSEFDLISRAKPAGPAHAELWNHDKWKEVKKAATKKAIEDTVKVINQFKAAHGRYPERLIDLVLKPVTYAVNNYPEKGYLQEVPKDGFGYMLRYNPQGTGGEPFDLYSWGADNQEGGSDENEDLWNHDKRPPKKEEPKKDEKKN